MSFRANAARDLATLPGAYARELIDLCGRFDVRPSDVLAGTGLAVEALSHPSTRVDLRTFERIVRQAEHLTQEPGLAVLVGRHMRLSWHGFLGFAAMTAGTLAEALDLAERFGRTRTDAITLVTRVHEGEASIVLEEHVPLGGLREFLVTSLFLGLATIGHSLIGVGAVDGAVEMTHGEPPYFARFLAAVPELAAVRFRRPVNRMVFPRELLARRIVSADPAAMDLAREQCERELAALGEGARLAGRVRTLVRERYDGMAVVAKKLGVSERTLKRRLADQGTTFSRIVDDARRAEACLLLADPRWTLDRIAARLGYSDTGNFTRAFRRWTGETPGAWRARAR